MTTTKVVPGILIAAPDAATVAREAAVRIARTLRDAIEADGLATLALSGGNTPRDAYGLLARDKSVDWTKVDVFWVDERAVPATDDRSNFRHAKEQLLGPARIPMEHIHRMPGEAGDLAAAARDYEKLVRDGVKADPRDDKRVPSFDCVVLGVGDDGHTASLFPGEPTVHVADRLIASVPAKGAREARLTFTAPLLEAARSIVVMAVGKEKNAPLERVWEVAGNLEETPARVIRAARGAVTWIIDRAAGGVAGA
ncbi:MAG: 6-phosphogluconolactonase [Polyangiaceae bacterium]|jgi:6-phosphogluconolactonase